MSKRAQLRKECDRAINNIEWAQRHIARIGATMANYGKGDHEAMAAMIYQAMEELKTAIQRLKDAI